MTTRGGIGSTGYGLKGVGVSTPGAPEYRNIGPSAYSMPHTVTTGDYFPQEFNKEENIQVPVEDEESKKNEENKAGPVNKEEEESTL